METKKVKTLEEAVTLLKLLLRLESGGKWSVDDMDIPSAFEIVFKELDKKVIVENKMGKETFDNEGRYEKAYVEYECGKCGRTWKTSYLKLIKACPFCLATVLSALHPDDKIIEEGEE